MKQASQRSLLFRQNVNRTGMVERCLNRINGIYRIVFKQVEQEMQELALCLSSSYFCISCSPCENLVNLVNPVQKT